MTKAVFTTKVDPTYDDLPEERYHFPSTYLRQVEAALGDWIVYYEPRRVSSHLSSSGGRQAYFAAAKVTELVQDPVRSDHYYAMVKEYLEFDHAVPFRRDDLSFEKVLTKADGSTNKGAFGRSVRNLTDTEFDLILNAGFQSSLFEESQKTDDSPTIKLPRYDGFSDSEQSAFQRPIVERLIARPFRDIAFVGAVKQAYENTCAMTGLKIINGGGRAEVQAAHIMPVAENGPDSVRNGIALSGTIHWMFDRGLISIDDDFSLLVAKQKVPDTIFRMLNSDGKLLLPRRVDLRPHLPFLKHHQSRFKG